MLFDAAPTIVFFLLRYAGVTLDQASLYGAALAAIVIGLKTWSGRYQDTVFLGCNIHFLFAGPLIWLLFLSGHAELGAVVLRYVLVGVPLAVLLVMVFRWRGGVEDGRMVGVAILAVGLSAAGAPSHLWAITMPLGLLILARVVLFRAG